MAGIDYRQIQGPAQVNTDLPDSGAAARAAALGSVFKEFEGVSSDIHTKAETQAGALAGAAAGATGHPQYRQGLERFTAYSQAFNNAATGAYAIQAQAQADESAARLRVSANNNPATFNATFTAARDAVLKEAPAMAVPMLTELYNRHLAAGLGAIATDQATEQHNLQRQSYDIGVQRQVSRISDLMSTGDQHDHLLAMDEQVKLTTMIDGGKNAGLYSDAEVAALHSSTQRQITSEVFSTQVDRELADPNGNVALLLDRFRISHLANLADPNQPPILSEPEYQKLFADASTKVREWRITQELMKSNAKTAEQIRFEAGDVKYTAALFDGKLTHKQLSSAVVTGDLKPETARALGSALDNVTIGRTDPAAYARVISEPGFLDLTALDIAALPGISTSDKKGLMNEQAKRKASWEGTQPVKDAIGAISAALKIPPGTPQGALSDTQKLAVTNAVTDFKAKMNLVDPAQRDHMAMSTAQEVVKGIQRQETQEQIKGLQNSVQRTLKAHGPGAADEWSSDKLKAYQEQRNAQIKALQQQLGAK